MDTHTLALVVWSCDACHLLQNTIPDFLYFIHPPDVIKRNRNVIVFPSFCSGAMFL